MNSSTLHIVSFDIPYPANYGGVIDVFYRIKSLYESGIRVVLHCFYKDRKPSTELENYCESVHYYRRSMNPIHLFSKNPFIIKSRSNTELFQNLTQDEHPVLFEGLHTTFLLENLVKRGKKCFVRTHNIEHQYYEELAKSESRILKKKHFSRESKKLEQFERILGFAEGIISISEEDLEHFGRLNSNIINISPFHPEPKIPEILTYGEYAFYHGNLEVAENQKAAQFLKDVFTGLDVNLIVAGKGAKQFESSFGKQINVEIADNPSDDELLELAVQAKVHLLPTFQSTGFKLKLLYSFYTARDIIANSMMVQGTGLGQFVTIAETQQEWQFAIQKSFDKLPIINLKERRKKLEKEYSNQVLVNKLIDFLR